MAKKIDTPLARKAVLVSVNISQWTARKLDKRVTEKVNREHNAADDAGRYNKLLIEAERLKKINTLVSQARSLHEELTRPWVHQGPRILPNALFAKFSDRFRAIKREFEQAADEFARGYPDFVEERRRALNGLFRADDYPSPSQIRAKFKLEMTILPFPDAADFRADLDEDTVADIKAEIAATSDRVVDEAMKHTARQIIEIVGHMAEKLKAYNGGSDDKGDNPRSFFFPSLVTNVRDLADLLPAFNLANDPKLTAITKRIHKELCAEDASVLRENEKAHETVRKSADDIVKAVEGLLG